MLRKPHTRPNIWFSLIMSLIISALTFISDYNDKAAKLTRMRKIDNFFSDRFMVLRNSEFEKRRHTLWKKSYRKIKIIAIDEGTIQKYGNFSLWGREKLLILLKKLEYAGAKVVFVDILLTTPSNNPTVDRMLADLYYNGKNLILPMFLWVKDFDVKTKNTAYQFELPFFYLLKNKVTNLDEAKKLKRVYLYRSGSVGVHKAERDVIRRVFLFQENKGGENTFTVYHAMLLTFLKYKGLDVKDIKTSQNRVTAGKTKIPLNNRRFRINYPLNEWVDLTTKDEYSIRDEDYLGAVLPLEQVLDLEPEMMKAFFKDKIVLVGPTAPELGDIKETPVGKMPGVFINATILFNLLNKSFLYETSKWVELVILLSIGLLIVFINYFIRPLIAGVAGALSLFAYLFAGYMFFSRASLLIPMATPLISISLHILILVSYFYVLEERQKNQIKNTFGEYLSPEVVEDLLLHQAEGQLGIEGKNEVVTVFYSDIRGFTSMSENMKPEEVVSILNEYFDRMAEIVLKYGGYIDKYIGDCIMAIFTAPVPTPDDAEKAVLSAIEQQEEIMKLKQEWKGEGRSNFYVGMGINTGEVVLGNIGSHKKKDYTVIGDNVNLAARLYDQARGGQILISASTHEQVKHLVEARFFEKIHVKGKKKPVDTYEILGRKGEKNLLDGYAPKPREGGH